MEALKIMLDIALIGVDIVIIVILLKLIKD